MKALILMSISMLLLQACGVKGRPLPPEKPAELGRGKPTFTKSSDDFRFRNIPPVETEVEEEQIDEDKR